MEMDETIRTKLESAFAPASLDVINESHLHAGHAGSSGTGDTHYRVKIVAAAFDGKSRLERHRLVNEALVEELAGSVHALAIRAASPAEVA